MSYLSGVHIYKQIYDYGNYVLDITGFVFICKFILITLVLKFYFFSKFKDLL